MNTCQYPGCTKPAKKKWCVTHNCIVAKERALARWHPRTSGLHEPKGHHAYENMILGYNGGDSGRRQNDFSDRPMGLTGAEFEVKRGHKMPRPE